MARLTQKQLAIGAGITPQVVLKAEQGLYGMIPPKLLSSVAEVSGLPEEAIELSYRNWQCEARYEQGRDLKNSLIIADNMGYREFQESCSESVLAFCRMLCIHPAQWGRLSKSGGDSEFFRTAMREADLEWCLAYLKD